MIGDIRRTGLSNTSYIMRAKILKQFREIQTHPNIAEFFLLDCETNVGTLARRLLKNVPSFEEISICKRGCPPRKKYFPIFSISRRALLCENREDFIENCISLDNSSHCTIADCDGRVHAQLMTKDDLKSLGADLNNQEEEPEHPVDYIQRTGDRLHLAQWKSHQTGKGKMKLTEA
ncbi:hypothetical protein JTB14_034616 [Gonioctena quinquepunctata]|nr:hypothetical protein JTB14_034616 [Gonioctena quinquepunctata]